MEHSIRIGLRLNGRGRKDQIIRLKQCIFANADEITDSMMRS